MPYAAGVYRAILPFRPLARSTPSAKRLAPTTGHTRPVPPPPLHGRRCLDVSTTASQLFEDRLVHLYEMRHGAEAAQVTSAGSNLGLYMHVWLLFFLPVVLVLVLSSSSK